MGSPFFTYQDGIGLWIHVLEGVRLNLEGDHRNHVQLTRT
ncbi:MAG: hypothetical protein ACI9F9_002216 [Candidatus Paceibacteria bacterium]|jgi:hypothetical protein